MRDSCSCVEMLRASHKEKVVSRARKCVRECVRECERMYERFSERLCVPCLLYPLIFHTSEMYNEDKR